MMEKERLDQLVVTRGLAPSREKARALIMAGQVFVDGAKAEKSGLLVRNDAGIELKGRQLPYVSRGGLKLEKALDVFNLDVEGKVMLDVGASTGGFTDCALQRGARRVYAVDVGYGQLDWALRQDPRVVCIERKNARYLSGEDIPEPVDLVTIDVSFISLEKIIPVLIPLLQDDGSLVALIKPQFEAGRDKVGKKGVVKDRRVHAEVILRMLSFCSLQGLEVLGLDFSPITGPEGNIEFLLWAKKEQSCQNREADWEERVKTVLVQAHGDLRND